MNTDTWPSPSTPPPPPAPKKMSVAKKALIGVAALFVVGAVFSAGEESASQTDDTGVPVTTTPYRPPTTSSVTAADIIDVVGAERAAEFCVVLDEARASGASDSEIFAAFTEGYRDGTGGQLGLPSASAVWSALKSYCSTY